jgi:choice-of-anchor C domain-containing protein
MKRLDLLLSMGLMGQLTPAVSLLNAGENLLVNGGFEIDSSCGGQPYLPMPAGSTGLAGWTISQGSVDLECDVFVNVEGDQAVELNGSEPGAIRQRLSTPSGGEYLVSFSMSGNPLCGPTVKTLIVQAAGQSAEFSFDNTGTSLEDMGWVVQTWQFAASQSQTTIEFRTLDPGACGAIIDDLSVTRLPPPEHAFGRGDANGDGAFDLSDSIALLGCLFQGYACLSCPDAIDSNDDGKLDIADPIYLLNWQFLTGAKPSAPFPECGADPTADGLKPCEAFPCRE